MTLTETEYDEIVAHLYAAGCGRIDWHQAFERLVDKLDLWAINMVGLSKPDHAALFAYEGGRAGPEVALDYLRTYHRINPRLAPTLALSAGRGQWMHCHEHFDDAFVSRDPYYQEFLIPHGGRYTSATKLLDDSRYVVLLSVSRGRGQQPLKPDEVELVDRLRRHLYEAVRIHLDLRNWLQSESAVGRHVLNRMHQAMLLADEQLHIAYRNPAAQRLLEKGQTFGERNDRLVCRNQEDDLRLRQAIRDLDLANATGGRRPLRRTVARIKGTGPAYPTLVLAMAVRPESGARAFGQKPLALLLLHATASRRPIDPLVVGEVFQLTPAEAHVAAGVGEGLSVAEIAEARGVAAPTVSAQIRAVYSKTAVRNRAELVRILLDLPMFESGGEQDEPVG